MSSTKSEGQPPIDASSVPPNRASAEEQPRWRRDFPIDWPDDDYVSRRDLVKYVVLTSGAFVVGQLWIAWKSVYGRAAARLEPLAVASAEELPVGGAKIFEYPEGSPPRLLVRTGDDTFVAYEQQCTHLQCPVIPAVEQGRLHCPCHNGWFDLETGVPVAGPPRRPLRRVQLEVRNDAIYATGIEEPET